MFIKFDKVLYSKFKHLSVLPRLSCFILLFLYAFGWQYSQAQDSTIERIQAQPTSEVYDLLKDTRGYLWVAHDLGVSRYDGSSFVSFSTPLQNSFAMTDLIEDHKGRIWCHNFTGQIFYIERMKLHLLKEYKYKEEQGFPRIIICGNELVATSIKGLFVYNLLTDQSKYYSIPKGTRSLTKVGNKVICYGSGGWYSYEAGHPIRKLSSGLSFGNHQAVTLQNTSYKDTFYLTVNPMSTYYKLTLEGDVIKVHEARKASAFINTVTVDNDKVWVHTKINSFTTNGKEFIDGLNLSDIILDSNGYTWMSSLKKGVCVQYNTQRINKLVMSSLSKDDYIRKVHTENNYIFLASANGGLYQLDAQASITYLLSIPKSAGIIEQIAAIGSHQFILCASVGMYLYDTKTRQLQQLDPSLNVKEIMVHKGTVYAASGIGIKYSRLDELSSKKLPFNVVPLDSIANRCRSFAFAGDSLLAAYSDGVYVVHKGVNRQLLYKGHPIYASKIKAVSNKVLIGTYNQGLLILENGSLRSITEKDGLISNNIKDIKESAGSIWLLYYDAFQQLNHTLTGIEEATIHLSNLEGINDIGVLNKRLYIAANEGVFSMYIATSPSNSKMATYFDKVLANGEELISGKKLEYFQNHLQFHVSTPFYSPHSKIIYQYRIKNAADSSWQTGAPGQSVFNVVALEPGDYTFEIVAIDRSKKIISLPAIYQFEITPPWQQSWTFRIAAVITVIAISVYFVQDYYKSRLRRQRIDYEKKLAIQAERQRISSEIHDDIGAGLSAIRLLTEITKNKLPESEAQNEVSKIHASISELTQKMREVIWSLNTENDRLENLLFYIQRQAIKLFENSPIQLKISFPRQDIPPIVINGEKRRHIYLSVKEALHNCLKHSEAQICYLTIRIEESALQIIVADNGKGFVPQGKVEIGNGLAGMKRRMQQVKGLFEVQLKEGTQVKFIIPLNG
jgi:signal transduction histidine kinase/ligand-binding sensor domain-containing protein